MSVWIPLWCKSNYSFLTGASHPAELVEQAAMYGYPALGLTDCNGLYGAVRGHVQARSSQIDLIVGSEITLQTGDRLLLYAMDSVGYGNLCQLLSTGRLRSSKGSCSLGWKDIERFQQGLLAIALVPAGDQSGIGNCLQRLSRIFGDRLYLGIARHYQPEDARHETEFRSWARRLGRPLVALVETLYHVPERRPLQDVLACVRHGIRLDQAGILLHPNSARALPTPSRITQLWQDDPSALATSLIIVERCHFRMDQLRYRYPAEAGEEDKDAWKRLSVLAYEGARQRYRHAIPAAAKKLLDKELALIRDLDYSGYFLTMWEIVSWCKQQGILCQGRGSAANSIVCYSLGITAIDPVRMDLLFERFISQERAEPPDIDLDIEHRRREEVIRFVYRRYGRDHAAMVANVIRYRGKSALRAVGKVLGIAEVVLDRVAQQAGCRDIPVAEQMCAAGLNPDVHRHRLLMELSGHLYGTPRHLSIHPGGFLLGRDPIYSLVPIENASMEGRTVIQWDKDDVEAMGLFKVDLLGLGALHQLSLSFELLQEHYGVDMDMASIPPRDKQTYAMISRAETVGVFQIESRAQMAMLPRLRPRHFYDLVVEISLVRPGPISGGMVHPYLRRRNGEEEICYPHPSLEPVLAKTLGIPLFQEQVMKLAMVAADYSPGEADQLRRDMAAWHHSGCIERHHKLLVSRMVCKGIEREFAERVFEQIRGFGEYGFPESHAASFALIAYATAWLRCHYPVVFFCALINAQPMGFYSMATLIGDARRHGVEIRPLAIPFSRWDCTLEVSSGNRFGFALRMGLRFIKGLGKDDKQAFDALYERGQPASMAEVVLGSSFSAQTLTKLAEAGAFTPYGLDRRTALWALGEMIARRRDSLPLTIVSPDISFADLDSREEVAWDYAAGRHSARSHPLSPLRRQLRDEGLTTAEDFNRLPDGTRGCFAGLVICRQRPGTASGVTFMTLEDETGFVNLILWPNCSKRYRLLIRTVSFLQACGHVQSAQGVVHLIVDHLERPAFSVSVHTSSHDWR